jgi:hypothetical protein
MNKKALQATILFAVMISVTAAFLLRIQMAYKLGDPGVQVVQEPLYDENTNLVANISVALPKELPGYVSIPMAINRLELNMLPPDTVFGRRAYKADDGWATMLSVVLMGTDRTSIHKPQYCLLGAGWSIEGEEVIDVPMWRPELEKVKVMKLTCSRQVRTTDGKYTTVRGLYLYWFVADGVSTPHHFERMWMMGKHLVTTGELQRWSYISVLGQCMPGQEEILLKRLKGFLAESFPKFDARKAEKSLASAPGTLQPHGN